MLNYSRASSHGAKSGRRGGALVMVAVATAAMAALSFSLLMVSNSGAREMRTAREVLSARYVCEAALAESMLDVYVGGDGTLGSENVPVVNGDSSYWVDGAKLPNNLVQLTATGIDNRAGARVELVLLETTSNIFTWGAFGDTAMSLDSNATVDSYDSALGDYASQQVNGSGASKYAGSDGDVGSNGNVKLKQNSVVHGDALPGPGSSTTLTGNAVVSGSTAPMATTVEMPVVTAPVLPSAGNLTVPSATPLVLTPGSYRWDDFDIDTGGTVEVEGPAQIVLSSFYLSSNSEFIVDGTNGPVEIWIEHDFEMDSNTLIASKTYTPADIAITLLGDNVYNPVTNINMSNVSFDSNAKLYGTVYAPNAEIEIDSNFELFGSLVAKAVDIDSNAKIHYDLQLQNVVTKGMSTFAPVSWRVMPYKP